MRKPIEFQESDPSLISPLQPSNHLSFQDLLLKPEYKGLKYTLPKGTSTFRVLPAIKGSPHWLAHIHALDNGRGRHAHAKTFEASSKSVFDTAQEWLKQHEPDALYRKNNPSGHKLWTTQLAAYWILIEGPEPPELRILISSAFAGSRQGAQAGLGYKIQELVSKNPKLLGPDAGHQIKVTRAYSAGCKYPETQISTNQTSTSLNELLGQLNAEDLDLVRPIMDTINRIEPEQEWALLAMTIGQELTEKIRAASTAT